MFEGYGMRLVLQRSTGKFVRLSVGRELKVGQLQGVHYGYAHVSIPSGDGGKPHLAVIKVSRITSCELWEKE
jgi:hypothetical protein